MALSWSARRQLLYYAVATVVFLILIITVQQTFFSNSPSCFDNRQNGGEAGVDCGSPCSLLCSEAAHAPQVLWTRAFPTGGTLYTAAAYIQNTNSGAGTKGVAYSIQLLDETGNLIATRDGTTDLPPLPTIPIVEPNIDVGNRTVSRALLSFSEVPVWNKIDSKTIPILHVTEQQLAEDGTRLSANIKNDSLQDAEEVWVFAVLFDASDTARAASKSFIQHLGRKSSQPVVFTWPQGVEGVVRAEISILPPF